MSENLRVDSSRSDWMCPVMCKGVQYVAGHLFLYVYIFGYLCVWTALKVTGGVQRYLKVSSLLLDTCVYIFGYLFDRQLSK